MDNHRTSENPGYMVNHRGDLYIKDKDISKLSYIQKFVCRVCMCPCLAKNMSRHWKANHPQAEADLNAKELLSKNLKEGFIAPYPVKESAEYWNQHCSKEEDKLTNIVLYTVANRRHTKGTLQSISSE